MSKTFKSVSIIFFITVGIKIIDVLKNLIIASKIGVSNDADVFSALISLPDSVLVLIGIDSLRGVVNSEYSTLYTKDNNEEINRSFNNLFKIIFYYSIPVFLLMIFFNNELISVMFPGFSGLKKETALQISYFIIPVFLFKALGGFIQSLYNSTKRFYFPVILTSVISIVMIIAIFLPYINDNIIYNLALAYLTGNILIVIMMISNFGKFNVKIDLSFPRLDPLTKKIIKSCGAITVLVVFNQIFLSSRMFFASFYGEGAISSLNYSSAITAFITTMTFNSVFSVFLSNLSSLDSEKNIEGMKNLFSVTIEVILFIFIPISFIFILFDVSIIKLFYFRGNFDYNGITKVSFPFFWDSLSIISWIFYIIPTAFFLAIKKYKILTLYGSISYVVGILLNYYLSMSFGYYGVAIASFITTLLYGLLLLNQTKKILIDISGLFANITKLVLSGTLTLISVYFVKIYLLKRFTDIDTILYLISGGVIYLIIYFIISGFLKVNYFRKIRSYLNY